MLKFVSWGGRGRFRHVREEYGRGTPNLRLPGALTENPLTMAFKARSVQPKKISISHGWSDDDLV